MTTDKDRLSNSTEDLQLLARELIKQRFPMCVSADGEIDLEALKLLLGASDGTPTEAFGLRWPGRREAIQTGLTASDQTLVADQGQSVDFDTTQNLLIEGDNLEALKLLRKHYQSKVKMIYVDPPYNTGSDFIYRDDFSESTAEYLGASGQSDEHGNVRVTGAETAGKIHRKWLSMMYPRLALAHRLLSEDGLIFISIDDNEFDHLMSICGQIFGRENFLGTIIVEGTPKNDPDVISTAHEYCVCFAKNKPVARLAEYGLPNANLAALEDIFNTNKHDENALRKALDEFLDGLPDEADNIRNYKHFDSRGIYRVGPIDDPQGTGPRDARTNPNTGGICKVPKSGWRCNLETWNQWVEEGLIWFPDSDEKLPSKKTYALTTRREPLRALQKMQIRKDTEYLRKLFGTEMSIFANPKPMDLMTQLLNLVSTSEPVLVLDLFAGSGTLGDAALRTNAREGKNIRVISIQLPEEIDPVKASSNRERKRAEEAIRFLNKIGKPANIAEITKERLRRAGRELSPEFDHLDIGFRHFRIQDSNIDVWDASSASESTASLLSHLKDGRLKPGRSDEDVMFEVLVKYGVDLNSKIERVALGKGFYWNIGDSELAVVTSKGLTKEDLHALANKKPNAVVILDEAFEPESLKTNARATFKDAKIELKTF